MTEIRKRSLDEILERAQTLPPGQQLQFIRAACDSAQLTSSHSDDAQLSRQEWFEMGSDAAPDRAADESPDPAGRIIGAYRLVRSLGQGGMGEVFLAERADDQFRQQVAIKLVRRGLLSKHVQGRLRQERQILASLDHPNIARLHDGGTTDDGTPYIVMEYIDGEPLDIYCDRRQLTVEQRLRLFIIVCSAVHRAHQSLVVHRDLKPSNILVTAARKLRRPGHGLVDFLELHRIGLGGHHHRLFASEIARRLWWELTTAPSFHCLAPLLAECPRPTLSKIPRR